MRKILSIASCAAACIACSVPLPVDAGEYQALCKGKKACSVTLANGQISSSGFSIPRGRVLSWSVGGSGSRPDVGVGVARNVISRLPGLLRLPGVPIVPGLIGSGAARHDYSYAINHIDDDGTIVVTTIGFVNDGPANRFMLELAALTGLTPGQVNGEAQAMGADLKARSEQRKRMAARECRDVIKPYNCSWSAYIQANEAVRIWAEAHPQLVPAEKARLQAVE